MWEFTTAYPILCKNVRSCEMPFGSTNLTLLPPLLTQARVALVPCWMWNFSKRCAGLLSYTLGGTGHTLYRFVSPASRGLMPAWGWELGRPLHAFIQARQGSVSPSEDILRQIFSILRFILDPQWSRPPDHGSWPSLPSLFQNSKQTMQLSQAQSSGKSKSLHFYTSVSAINPFRNVISSPKARNTTGRRGMR